MQSMTRLPGRTHPLDSPPAIAPSEAAEHFPSGDGGRRTVIRDVSPTVVGGDFVSPVGPTERGRPTTPQSIFGAAALPGREGRGGGRSNPLSCFRFGEVWRRLLDWYTVGTVVGLIWEQVSAAL